MRRLSGFSLMEMMIVLLIVAIVAAASAPMINKKMLSQAGEKSPWIWTNLNNSIGYNIDNNENQTATIGAISAPNGVKPRLFIQTKDDNNIILPQILLGSSGNNTRIGITAANGNFWATTNRLNNNLTNSVVLGASANAEGDNSTALGYIATATGHNSTALGASANAEEDNSTALGYIATASNPGAIAIGAHTNASGTSYIAIGSSTQAEGGLMLRGANASNTGAISIGLSSQASGVDSTALGRWTRASGEWSTALGVVSKANGSRSVAIGSGAIASGKESIAIGGTKESVSVEEDNAGGGMTKANGNFSTAIGIGAQAYGNGSSAIGYGALVSGNNSISIGHHDDITSNNTIVIGNADDTVIIPGTLQFTNLHVTGNLVVDGISFLGRTTTNPALYVATYRENSSTIERKRLVRKDNTHEARLKDSWPSDDLNTLLQYSSSSDKRLKNIGERFKGGLAEIRKLKIFNYTFKNDKDKTPRVGVIAQDLQKIFPKAVTKGDDGFLRIRMEDMFYALINAVKENDSRITELEKQNKELLKRIEALEKKK